MSVLVWVLAAAPLFEVELRWVEQPLAPLGSLSTAGAPGGLSTRGHGVKPLGPTLRVAEGATAAWSLQLPGPALWLQGPRRSDGGRGALAAGVDAAWLFEASPRLDRQGRLQLRLRWQQPQGDGGSQQWQSELPLAEGRWTTVARNAPPAAPPDGALRTQTTGPVSQVQELQVRVQRVPE